MTETAAPATLRGRVAREERRASQARLALALALLAALTACADPRGVRCDPLAPGFPLCGV